MERLQTNWPRLLGLTFTLLAVWSIQGESCFAQTQDTTKPSPEVQQLRDRLQQLEQTVMELKGQLSALEEAKKNPAPKIVEATYSPVTPTTTSPVAETPAAEVPAPKPQDAKGESTFEIYGFAMMDAGYQFKQNDPDWFDVVRPVKLPAFKDQFAPDGKVFYGVRQSRLGVKSSTPTRYGELKTQFEFELFGTGVDAGQ